MVIQALIKRILFKRSLSASRCVPHTAGQAEGTQCSDTSFPTFFFLFQRHCVLSRILESLRVEWQNSTPRLTSTPRPDRRNGNINLSKYLISSIGDRTHNQSVFTVTPRVAAPRLASLFKRSYGVFLLLWTYFGIVIVVQVNYTGSVQSFYMHDR